MPFLAPLALLGLLFLPVVVAMYLLRLRRDEQIVPSTLLWQRLLADVEANAPWQKLRRSLLLLLQLLLVLLLAVLAARPFFERPAGLAGDVVLVIDTSASMAATDVTPTRLDAAKDLARERLKDLPAGGKVSVIAAGRTARVVANGTTDLGRVRAAIDSITVSPSTGDLGDALRLANALAARSGDAEILVATDAALASKPDVRLDHKVTVLQVGRGRSNQAIVALAVRTAPSGVSRSVFVSIANLDLERAERRLEVWGDGVLLEARDVYADPQTRSEVIIDDVPHDVSVVEVRLSREVEGGGSVADLLALDDRAWAIVPPDHLRRILLVGEGDPYLETALSYLPNTELYGIKLNQFGDDTHPALFDLIVFEGGLPSTLPDRPILAIAPARSSDLGVVTGVLRDPGIGGLDADEPILRYVDLSTTHVGTAQKLTLPEWARTVIPGPNGVPLLYTGSRGGLATAVLAFEPRQSDLPLQVGFPILMSNLVGELLGGSAAPTEAVAPGSPVSLPVPAGATGLTVTRPDGSTVELAPGTEGGTSVSFSQTDLLGVYSAVPIYPQATPGPSATPTATPTTAPSGTPGASASPGGSPTPAATPGLIDPNAPTRFAVDLFDPDESTIAPGSAAAIEALGRSPGASGSPGASESPGASASPAPSVSPGASTEPSQVTGGGTTNEPRPPARDELWVPIVLIVLLVLVVEWLVYQRDSVLRLWRGISGRLRGRGAT
jgi:hypothetical protein